jgi:hypothetical protein
LEQQDRQLKKDLFDRRFKVFSDTGEFTAFVPLADGDISLNSDEYRQFWQTMETAEMLLGTDVTQYLEDIQRTASELNVSAQGRENAIRIGDVNTIHKHRELLLHLNALFQSRAGVFRSYLSFHLTEGEARAL